MPGPVDVETVCRNRLDGELGYARDAERFGWPFTAVDDQLAYLQGCRDAAREALTSYGYTFGSDGIARPPQ